MVKIIAASLLVTCAGAFGSSALAVASPAHESGRPVADDMPDRPGAGTHFSRGGFRFDNSGHPVTGQGPNAGTQTLKDILEDAGVPNRGF